jgi:hypothetical protein
VRAQHIRKTLSRSTHWCWPLYSKPHPDSDSSDVTRLEGKLSRPLADTLPRPTAAAAALRPVTAAGGSTASRQPSLSMCI